VALGGNRTHTTKHSPRISPYNNNKKIVLRPEKFRVIKVKEDRLWKEVREAKEWIKEEVRGAVEAREEGWEEKDGVIF